MYVSPVQPLPESLNVIEYYTVTVNSVHCVLVIGCVIHTCITMQSLLQELTLLNMKMNLIFGLVCLALALCSTQAGPIVEEKGQGEVVDW